MCCCAKTWGPQATDAFLCACVAPVPCLVTDAESGKQRMRERRRRARKERRGRRERKRRNRCCRSTGCQDSNSNTHPSILFSNRFALCIATTCLGAPNTHQQHLSRQNPVGCLLYVTENSRDPFSRTQQRPLCLDDRSRLAIQLDLSGRNRTHATWVQGCTKVSYHWNTLSQ